jgi:hypothetical protein
MYELQYVKVLGNGSWIFFPCLISSAKQLRSIADANPKNGSQSLEK